MRQSEPVSRYRGGGVGCLTECFGVVLLGVAGSVRRQQTPEGTVKPNEENMSG